ncbi:aminopeptidase 2 [Nematocida parisii]|nr:aminopeptidase 2 [Nematocida parisii]KAI5125508.1 aminopeptidase 2 [Nematocida parisii]KAI5140610.1 aminopeptidase 2 [Nematocida parisii]
MCMTKGSDSAPTGEKMDLRLPTSIKPETYDLQIVVKENTSEFKGVVVIMADVHEDTDKISFHKKGLSIDTIRVVSLGSGGEKDIGLTDSVKGLSDETPNSIVTISVQERLKAQSKIRIEMEYTGKISEDMAGFYKSEDKEGGVTRYIYSTQFEATSARLAFPCWDEPEFKAVFNISITAPSKFTVLSNAALADAENNVMVSAEGEEKGAVYTRHTFKPTPIMSTYLVAWVIGELDYVEKERIKVYTPLNQKETGVFSLEVAVRCLKFFEEFFGIEYQMEKLDMVAIPNFSAGAMENWGLVTYRSSSLLYREDSTSEINKVYIAETVCHELAHQWFGNLVTMKWWNDLWLNEGFATWAGTLATEYMAEDMKLVYNPWELFLESDITRGMIMDGKLSTHPINVKVESVGEISSIFDAISYSKGASMIHMLSKYLKEENFMKGLRNYIQKHKYKNTETNDLWKELDSGDKEIENSMKNWIDTPGFPKVQVSLKDGNFALKQSRYLPAKDLSAVSGERSEQWMIFLTKKIFTGGSEAEEKSILFSEKKKELPEVDGQVMFNADATGFYLIEYSDEMLEKHILPLLESDKLSQFDRFGIFRDVIRLSKDGHKSALYSLNFVQYMAKTERSFVVALVAEYLEMIRNRFKEDKEIELAVSTEISNLLQQYIDGRLNFETTPEDAEEKKLAIIAVSCLSQIQDSPIQKEVLRLAETNELSKVHKDYKMSMYISYAKFGGEKAYKYLESIIQSSTADENEKLRAVRAISFSEENVADAFKLFSERNHYIKSQDKFRMADGLARNKKQRKTLDMFLSSFNDIKEQFLTTKDNVARFIEVFISVQYTRENIEVCREFFSRKENNDDAWVSAIKKGFDAAENSNRFYEENRGTLKAWAADEKQE